MTEPQRPDPDALLAELQRTEQASRLGRLFIFLGMCPGVGKTYAMLQAARQRQKEGARVLVGVVETHGRSETAALLTGLPVLPRRQLEHRGHTLEEFDLDAVLQQRPDLVLVDELAHSNVPGSRHAKRYQDVLELVGAGLDVYTTVNVQHIESQVDIVRQITDVTIRETVPDSILDHADEIELVDLSVEKLLDRMASGKVYLGDRAEWAVSNFFKEGNLTALREMALRFTAEHVDRDLVDIRRARRVSTAWKTQARLLVGVGPSPYSESLIRWTRRAAARLGCQWIVAWVDSTRRLVPAEQERLARSLALARKLGAEVVSVSGEDVAAALLQVARERNVSQIVVGKPGGSSWWRKSLSDRLVQESGDIDVCMVRPESSGSQTETSRLQTAEAVMTGGVLPEYFWAIGLTFGAAVLGWLALAYTGYVFVGLLFLLVVILAAVRLARGPVLLMAALSAFQWDYFFIPPRFTFHINQPHDIVMFVMFFIVAFSMGHLTTRLRQREQAERRRQRQTAALLRVTQSAALTAEPERGLEEALTAINEFLRADTAVVVRNLDRSLPHAVHAASTFQPSGKEWGVINWSYQNKQAAGRFTDTLPESEAAWFPLQTATSQMGVFGVRLREASIMDFTTRQSIEAFALQLALVLEKEHFIFAVRHAELMEQSERLQRTLLDSVSHELKTPLAVIHAALEGLSGTKNAYLDEIHTASARLQRVVNHLLQMTRIESAAVRPVREWCVVGDLIEQAKESAGAALDNHPLTLDVSPDLPAVKLDPNLFSQALANILHNAAVYTPPGSPVEVQATLGHGGTLTVRIADRGPGLPAEAEEQVFQKFYRGPGSPTGGTGLGLSITRALLRSLDGEVKASNRPGGGAEFVITLPVETLLTPSLP
ncbi:sensor histidine kinase KdpD [Verrucomicrobium sp. BvORR106]|uniref:sensor histidine kinase n=1 Tax=Verrucomicrobium sp. BvORR106 TaxID=1403819 RepID=UPI00056FC994|nr:sensor histidine kinase KdpD [Verrucomicrobium sp. BvORR106]